MIIMDFYRRRPRHRAARPTIFTLKLLTVCSCDKELESDSWLFRTKCFKSTYDLVNEYKARKKFNLCASIHDTELNETVLTEYLFMSFFLFSFLSPHFRIESLFIVCAARIFESENISVTPVMRKILIKHK